MCKLPALILLVFCLYLFSSQPAFASTLFTDNFNDGNSTGWEEHLGSQGSWSIENGEYVGRVVKDSSEDLPTYSITGDGNWDNYQFDVRIKAQEGVDKIILFRYTSLNQTYAIKLISSWWDWYGDKIALLKNNLIGWTANTTYVNSIGNWYKISVAVNGPNIKIYVNDSISPVINYTDSNNPNTKGKIGLLVWPGYYGGYGSRTTTSFDDVVVTSLESPPPENNLILLPGLGASWNHEAMILDQEKLPEEWQMTPSIKTYDGLIQTLKYAGYKTEGPDQNLFIFNYDWRKPVAQIANDLKNYIGRHPPPSDKKIDLVGHSLGGLVARTYVQNNPENQINKLITVGSPHQGAVKTYYLWEGADLSQGLTGWQRYGAGILLQLHKKIYENNVEAIHSFAPGLKDILPTFPYLKYRSTEKPLANMLERNFWLENLNHLPLPGYLISNANTMIGSKGDTLRWIRTENRGMVDQVLGKWVDGKPNGEEYALGDNTVLLQSAELPGANIVEL
ncbi:MAG: alpha/beta fold hydrolase, partial [bacterium]|nr:alpha/beta fold hydrolase [bacterium]